MAEDEDPQIAAVLAKLAGQDVAAAEDARAALEWIAGDQGLVFITQQRIQNFCWYDLPVKWLIDIQDSADRFGWDFSRPPRTEDDLYDLYQLRHFAQDLGLARRSGRKLTLTAKGRRLLADPGSLWRAVAVGLLGDNGFFVYAGELFLALLLGADPVPDRESARAAVPATNAWLGP